MQVAVSGGGRCAWLRVSAWPIALLLVLWLGSGPLLANEVEQSTRALIEAKIQELQASNLSAEQQKPLLSQLDNALKWLASADSYDAQTRSFQDALQQAPLEAEQLRLTLEQERLLPDEPLLARGQHQDLATVEAELRAEQARSSDLNTQLTVLRQQIDGASAQQKAAQARQRELRLALTGPEVLASDGGGLEDQVFKLASAGQRQAQQAELRMLDAALASETVRASRRAAERNLLEYQLSVSSARSTKLLQLQQRLQNSVEQQALKAAAALLDRISRQAPELGDYAQRNRELAELSAALAAEIGEANAEAEATQQRLDELTADTRLVQRRLAAGGRRDVIGQMMLAQLDRLANTDNLERQIQQRNEMMADHGMQRIDADEESRDLRDGGLYRVLHWPDYGSWPSQRQRLADQLVDQRQQLLDKINGRFEELGLRLVETNARTRELIDQTVALEQFLIGQLMWVHDYSYLNLSGLMSQLAMLFNPHHWWQLPSALWHGLSSSPLLVAALLLWLLLLGAQMRLRQMAEQLHRTPLPISEERVSHSLRSLGLGILRALPMPAALALVAGLLSVAPERSDFLHGLERGLDFSSRVLFCLLLLDQLTRHRGFARRFLKWPARPLELFQAEWRWFVPVAAISIFVSVFAVRTDFGSRGGPLAVVGIFTFALALLVIGWRLQQRVLNDADVGVRLALKAGLAVTVGVLLLPLFGATLALKMFTVALMRSIALVVLIKITADLIKRWLLNLRFRVAQRAREQQRLREQQGEDGGADGVAEPDSTQSLSVGHEKLLMLCRTAAYVAGLWLIWAPSLPALNLFDSMVLWTVTDGSGVGMRAITLFDLLLALVTVVVTYMATRYLPSLVQVIVLERMSISTGVRYATTMLLQYAVIAVGASHFFTSLGWEWSQLQWLVAALGVGIGFGLQEIVANFISGLILLFERPISVGDLVTVDGNDGVVKRINIRATVIETFDRKELFVPNKDLITKQVINWTHTDSVVRVLVEVGIAYGSDVRQAMALVEAVARSHPNVLAEPEPVVSFDSFGDNALLLTLRCYVAEERLRVATELRLAINEQLAAAGIDIAFPQRDLHVEFKGPLQLSRPQDKGRG